MLLNIEGKIHCSHLWRKTLLVHARLCQVFVEDILTHWRWQKGM